MGKMSSRAALFVAACWSCACSGPPDESTDVDAASGELIAGSANAEVLAFGTLPNGNTIGFYDAGELGIMWEEIGKAREMAIRGNASEKREKLREAWAHVAAGEPFPEQLAAFEDVPALAELPWEEAPEESPDGGGEPAVIAKSCSVAGAACCDTQWILTKCSEAAGGDWEWTYYDYGWSWTYSGSSARAADVFVCAGRGTSVNRFKVGDSWSNDMVVPEGYYGQRAWTAGWSILTGWLHRKLRSYVNSESDQHAHSHCGSYWY